MSSKKIIKYNLPMKLIKKNINGFTVWCRNSFELSCIYDEVFKKEEYKFSCTKEDPVIMDCGSHIGIAILYFKSMYPKAQIIGFEPNPQNFEILQQNIKENNLKDVVVHNLALSGQKGEKRLFVSKESESPWTWGDTIVDNFWGSTKSKHFVDVKTDLLSSYINKPVDYIKMDIEGSEKDVIEEIKDKLGLVKEMTIEFHGTKTSRKLRSYSAIKRILVNAGFTIHTHYKHHNVPLLSSIWRRWIGEWVADISAKRIN